MNNEIEIPRTADIVAAEIRALTASVLTNIIEIGRRMCEIKEMLPHGEFGEWIKLHTGYSSSTANNFMRLFNEYGSDQGSLFGADVNCQTFGNLSYTKALALLAVPAEEREEFVKNNNVDDMSTRELTQAIKERDEAIERAKRIEQDLNTASEKILEMEREEKSISDERDSLQKQIKELQNRPVEVAVQEPDEAFINEKVSAAVAELSAKHKEETDKLVQDLEKQTKKNEKLAKALDKAKADIENASDEEERKRLSAEVEKLNKQLAMSGTEITAFKVHFSAWQDLYRQMMSALNAIDEENSVRLKAAVSAQLEAWIKGE